MKSVLILMSTYNGEKYLKTQIDSLLAQKNVNVSIVVRDDGSTDGTISILNYRAAKKEELTAARPFLSMVGTNFCRIPSYSILLSYSAPLT